MGEQLKGALTSTKEFWNKQSKKKKIIMLSVLGAVILIAIVATILLNSNKKPDDGYVLLYQGIDKSESSKVYTALQEKEVPVQMNENGEVMVPTDQKDKLLIELSELGYPKTAPTYNIFSDNAGLTATEFEQKQYLLFQLQDRIEKTLMYIDGVENAIVTLNLPQESSYVWDEDNNSTGSASVLLTLKDGVKLPANKISAIKNLVSSSVPKMKPEDVTIVDAKTSLELKTNLETEENLGIESTRLNFEEEIEKRMADKVMHVLSLPYGTDGVRVSATVVIDYDKMMTEQMKYSPEKDGNGVKNHLEESYTMDNKTFASGVAGEENNTDVPIYVDSDGDGQPEAIDYSKKADYLVSYMKQQIEKDKAKLKSASLAIVVDETNLTPEKQQQIITLASKATNVAPENISVSNISATPAVEETPAQTEPEKTTPEAPEGFPWMIIVAAGSLLLLLALFLLLKKRKAQKLAKARAKEAAADMEGSIDGSEEPTVEEEHRQSLIDAAEAANKKENAITDEIKDFAKLNPEITASLIRTWLREDE